MTHCFGVRRGGQRRLFCSVSLHDTLNWALLPVLHQIPAYTTFCVSICVRVKAVSAGADQHISLNNNKHVSVDAVPHVVSSQGSSSGYYSTKWSFTLEKSNPGWYSKGGGTFCSVATVVFLFSSLSWHSATSSVYYPMLPPLSHPQDSISGIFVSFQGQCWRSAYGCVIIS